MQFWRKISKGDKRARELADRHYTRQTIGAASWTRPGFNLPLLYAQANGRRAVFNWWRPHWDSGIKGTERKDRLRAFECTIFRNETRIRSSDLIRDAVRCLQTWERYLDTEAADGIITGVGSEQTRAGRSVEHEPGYCFRKAGFEPFEHKKGTADVWLRYDGPMPEPRVPDSDMSETKPRAVNHGMPLKESWGTPRSVLGAVTAFMGGIDVDPCSDAAFQSVVNAGIFYTAEGLTMPWFGRVWLNPPGGKRNGVIPWWNRLVQLHAEGSITEACYLSFALEAFQSTQTEKAIAPILAFPTIVFAHRLRFLETNTLIEQKNPWKPCALTWLPPRETDRTIDGLAELLKAFEQPGMVICRT